MTYEIRALTPDDAEAFLPLRRESLLLHPLAFGSSPEDDRGGSLEFMRTSLADHDRSAIFGLFVGTGLRGIVGILRSTDLKGRHKSTIWGMYVAPDARGNGAGRRLLDAAVGWARSHPEIEQIQLAVSESAIEAHRLYESAGFLPWGTEPRALQCEGEFVDLIHMALDLRVEPGLAISEIEQA